MAGETIGAAMVRTGGRSSGFDYLRLGLSVAVLAWHAFRISYFDFPWDGWYRPLVALILPMFFALSGLLVSGSLVRVRSYHEFVLLRVVRIVPALAVEVVLSAVVIGTVFTTLPLDRYLASPEFLHYFRNIYGDVHFDLPGVFRDHPMTAVNGSLWTIPFELMCYLAILALWAGGLVKRPLLMLGVACLFQMALPFMAQSIGSTPDTAGPVPGGVLVVSFVCGAVLFFLRDRVRLDAGWAVAALLMSLTLLSFGAMTFVVALPAAYVTIYLGLLDPPRPALLTRGDYSYGLYLYAFPVQQAITSLLPGERHWWLNIPLTLVVAGGCAVFSWHFVEKPILGQRQRIIGFGDWIASVIRTTVGRKPRVRAT
ncbi:acyltransferase [Sphingosinicellaceae bacterium]|nr:acyltransferase [Sphingosinicellaceae bacterium]